MTAIRLQRALLVSLSLALVLLALHLRSFMAAKPVANRLHEQRHSNPGRRLLTQQRQSPAVTDESKCVARPHNPAVDLVAPPVLSMVHVKGLEELSKPDYLQLFRNPQHICSPPS